MKGTKLKGSTKECRRVVILKKGKTKTKNKEGR